MKFIYARVQLLLSLSDMDVIRFLLMHVFILYYRSLGDYGCEFVFHVFDTINYNCDFDMEKGANLFSNFLFGI